ncbi:helix-turn-helix transcriptional regulator [Streptomyces sp. NBC_01264]|uniref:helix-turn-helix transcriptional regulator n=1 Tax=Streptomyces sp. NBC_01264 TaxID=2903804 RepID=UPI0022503C27|nr:helix-turn-helix transcriptional regulator [Streptomyces sp. NBC_01264]MCX4783341.1 helix-turn-helix transcriptional regulator [Streptomyces sp. NBC_01264]
MDQVGPESFAEQLREARLEAGLSHSEMAAKIGVGRRHEIRLEAGGRAPSSGVLRKLRELFGLGERRPASMTITLAEDSTEEYVAAVTSAAAQAIEGGRMPEYLEEAPEGSLRRERVRAKRHAAQVARKAVERTRQPGYWDKSLPEVEASDHPGYRSHDGHLADQLSAAMYPRRSHTQPAPPNGNPFRGAIVD